jgi:SRSO17 transposase
MSPSFRRPGPDPGSAFDAFVAALVPAFGHADREGPMRAYATGLVLPGERKSIEPMAARVAPTRVRAMHQAMHHFIAEAPWSDAAVLAAVRARVLPAFARHGGVTAWIVDDTGIPKKGRHSVGVARQYCGQRGTTENCQVAVSLSVANATLSLPIAYRLYLPEAWASDRARRTRAGVPADVAFQTKPEIALTQVDAALAAGVPRAPVLTDPAYGDQTAFRTALTARGLRYVVGSKAATTVWPEGTGPLPPKRRWRGWGNRPTLLRRTATHRPVSVEHLALAAPARDWRLVTWRDAAHGRQRSRFLVRRVRPAHRDFTRRTPHPEEWLLVEWPAGEPEPTHYWLSTLPADTPPRTLVCRAKLRWRVERDYEELKQELGLTHFEGRNWRGFHHHATMTIAAYASLLLERARFSPQGVRHDRGRRARPAVSARPPRRPAATAGHPPRSGLDSHATHAPRARAVANTLPLSVLPPTVRHWATARDVTSGVAPGGF